MDERHDTILIKLPLTLVSEGYITRNVTAGESRISTAQYCIRAKYWRNKSLKTKCTKKYTEEQIHQVLMYLPHSWSLEWLHICRNKGTAAFVHMHGRTNRLLFVSGVCEENEQQPLLQAQTQEKDHNKCHHMGVMKHLHLEVEKESWWWIITEKFQGSASGLTSFGPCAKAWKAVNKSKCFLVPDGHEPGGPQCSNLLVHLDTPSSQLANYTILPRGYILSNWKRRTWLRCIFFPGFSYQPHILWQHCRIKTIDGSQLVYVKSESYTSFISHSQDKSSFLQLLMYYLLEWRLQW